jgi:ABC-type antimicrobial peptide transport system permease subunit
MVRSGIVLICDDALQRDDAFVLRPLPGMVIGESLMLVVGGLLAGIPLSLAAGYLLRTFLFGIEPYDLLALVGATAVLTAVALMAALPPARRASRVDPVIALKYE